MRTKNLIIGIFLFGNILAVSCYSHMLMAADKAEPKISPEIKIDIPVILKKAKVVFAISHLSSSDDMPVALRYMTLMEKNFQQQRTEGQIIGIFYGAATSLILNDESYNARRSVSTGNPYKGLIAELQGQGVQIEVCVMAMKEQKIGNGDILKGVKVNGGANLRLVQLMQQGFVCLQP
jgi:intracellular sulfur oxidation DsrE/DsrF family protein